MLPQLKAVRDTLQKKAAENADVAMMCRTHGQSATPSTVGKELANFVYRLDLILEDLSKFKATGKFNGAVGNMNAHVTAYPELNWFEI